MVLSSIVIAPVMEEVVFRGLIFQRLAKKYSIGKALFFSSILFGILHAEAWIGASFFGLMMCLVFLHTRNLWVPIVLHVINNGIAVTIMCADGFDYVNLEAYRSDWPYYLVCILVLPAAYILIMKLYPKANTILPYEWNISHQS